MRSGVEPGKVAADLLHVQCALRAVELHQIGYFKLPRGDGFICAASSGARPSRKYSPVTA